MQSFIKNVLDVHSLQIKESTADIHTQHMIYNNTPVHPLHPRVVHSIVPNASECANPSGVNIVINFGRREKNSIVLSTREDTKGTFPENSNKLK